MWKYTCKNMISALNRRMKVELFWPWRLSSPISPLLHSLPWGPEDIWIMGLQLSPLFVYLHWRSLQKRGANEMSLYFLNQITLGPMDFHCWGGCPREKQDNEKHKNWMPRFYWLLILIMTFTTNAHMLVGLGFFLFFFFCRIWHVFHRS